MHLSGNVALTGIIKLSLVVNDAESRPDCCHWIIRIPAMRSFYGELMHGLPILHIIKNGFRCAVIFPATQMHAFRISKRSQRYPLELN